MTVPLIGLSWVNWVDNPAAILTASQEVSSLSVNNLADPIIGRRWRTTSTTASVTIDFGANCAIGVLALRFPRDTAFPLSGTIVHKLDVAGGTPGAGATYNSASVPIGAVDGYGYHIHTPPTAKVARYWRFTFAAAGVPFIDVGRAWAGAFWRPLYNIVYGYDDGWDDLSRITNSQRSGSEFVDERPRQRSFTFGLNALSKTERDDLREMQRIVGISKQLLFVKDPVSPSRESVLGRMAASTPIRHTNLPIFSKAFTVRESL